MICRGFSFAGRQPGPCDDSRGLLSFTYPPSPSLSSFRTFFFLLHPFQIHLRCQVLLIVPLTISDFSPSRKKTSFVSRTCCSVITGDFTLLLRTEEQKRCPTPPSWQRVALCATLKVTGSSFSYSLLSRCQRGNIHNAVHTACAGLCPHTVISALQSNKWMSRRWIQTVCVYIEGCVSRKRNTGWVWLSNRINSLGIILKNYLKSSLQQFFTLISMSRKGCQW